MASIRRLSPGLVLALLLACLPLAVHAQSDEEKARAQLRELQRDIQRINSEIASASARRDTLQAQLREAEKALGTLQRQIAGNRESIAERKSELEQLQRQRAEQQAAREEQEARVAAEMRAAWQMGRRGELKVLLSQEDPHAVARAMGYYRYLFEARNELLTRYRDTLAKLATLEQQIDTALGQLQSRQQTLEEQQQKLVAASKNRESAVARLNATISGSSAQLRKLEEDRKELEGLLKAIEEAVVNLQVPDNYQPFREARGKMPWPLQGKPSNRFGKPRNEGKMRWQGVNIPAKEGTPVTAIHHGRVVFADWLRGSGLLLIIDHGEGYMSLYAHNQSLLREVGEWVTAGSPIGTVGRSGGQDAAALYFEIRHQGKPVDPATWCRG
ncbi:MAG: peptidoglycan DD-metalloendopeptidase family protein [Halioglobus sp.]